MTKVLHFGRPLNNWSNIIHLKILNMNRFTKKTFGLLVLLLITVLTFGQRNLRKVDCQVSQTHQIYQDVTHGINPVTVPNQSEFNYNKLATSNYSRGVLYDNGPFITQPGAGSGGSDYSTLQFGSLGMSLISTSIQILDGNSIADDFTVDDTWTVSTITFFAMISNPNTSSPIIDFRFQIWDGDPTNGGSVIYGDLNTNKLISTEWSNGWRTIDFDLSESRPIMNVVADASGLVLTPGTYWIEFSGELDGPLTEGPWCSPITILDETTTGNALSNSNGEWSPVIDLGAMTPQGFPFIIEGTTLPQNDLAITEIIAPSTGVTLGIEEVSITIENNGENSQSNFEVTYSVAGTSTVTEIVTVTLESMESYNYTFAVLADLTAFEMYEIEACVNLPGDENPANDCIIKIVENLRYCIPAYSTGCNFGHGFSDFALAEIENYDSGCANLNGMGWSQYFGLGPAMLVAGSNYTITMASSLIGNNATVWVDWNDNNHFEETEIVVNNFNMGNSGELYEIDFNVPVDAIIGQHYMRARINFDNPCEDPCAMYVSGEAEDYLIEVVDEVSILGQLSNSLKLFPNPASVVVNISSEFNIDKIIVYDYTGSVLIEEIVGNNHCQINTLNLNSGIYIFKILVNNHTILKKVVIE